MKRCGDLRAYLHPVTRQAPRNRDAPLEKGVTDAPAVTASNLGIFMGSGTDIAKESAHIALVGSDLFKLVETLRVARHTRAIVWQSRADTVGRTVRDCRARWQRHACAALAAYVLSPIDLTAMPPEAPRVEGTSAGPARGRTG